MQFKHVICQIFILSLVVFFQPIWAESSESWYQTINTHITDTWKKGDIELFVPLKTYHLPSTYSSEQREKYTEHPYGLGIGKGHYNKSGNYEGMFVMGFQDSHGKPEYIAGYGWVPTWSFFNNDLKAGVGATGFITARSDIMHYTPFPGVLPLASISYKNLSLQATYIPPVDSSSGNVLFAWLKWTFD